jgi:hypothetical protein
MTAEHKVLLVLHNMLFGAENMNYLEIANAV